MDLKTRLSVFQRKSADAKPLGQILKPMSRVERDAAYAAGKARMDAAMAAERAKGRKAVA